MDWAPNRNPGRSGLVFALAFALAVTLAIVVPELALVARTREYGAQFANASGLTVDDPVHVAGVPSGVVTSVELAGDRVAVRFRLDSDRPLGDTTVASIKLATILGRRYLSVEPSGAGELPAGAVIPLRRTSVPFILDDLGRQATETTGELDLATIRQALDTVADTLPQDPELLSGALDGVSAVSQLVTDHNGQIAALLSGAQTLTAALLDQRETLVALLGDADLVLSALTQRRDTIRTLLDDVATLTALADGFLKRNSPALDSLLTATHALTDTLSQNEKALGQVIEQLGPTSRYLANITGNGNWGDVAAPAGPIPDNLLCVAGLLVGCQ
jgi:phospholipid/cholesterol/gamma-HCH transport system substrate-binding protein